MMIRLKPRPVSMREEHDRRHEFPVAHAQLCSVCEGFLIFEIILSQWRPVVVSHLKNLTLS